MSIDIEEWKKGIPQRELEQKIREYEEDYPKREKMTPQARENNQTRFFLEDRFYELHKQQLADMLKKQAEGNVLFGFGTDNQGIIPIAKNSSEKHTLPNPPYSGRELDSAYSGGGLEGTYSGRGLDSANTGLEASALTPASYGTAVSNGGPQVAGGYGNGYVADYAENDGWLDTMKNITRLSNDIMPPSHPLSFSHYPLDAATSFLIMNDNKKQMEREKQGRDYYYHPKATCEAAQLGGVPAAMSLGWGVAKEGKDMLCKTTGWCGPKMGFGEALSDSIKDMKSNWRGVKLGLSDRETPCSIQVRNNVYDPYKRR